MKDQQVIVQLIHAKCIGSFFPVASTMSTASSKYNIVKCLVFLNVLL